jgi:hypothetical protein
MIVLKLCVSRFIFACGHMLVYLARKDDLLMKWAFHQRASGPYGRVFRV